MIKTIASLLLKPLTSLGERYLENQADKAKLEAGTDRIVYEADAAVRKVKLGTLLGALPLFVAEITCAAYLASILIDSTFPSDYFNPLELPNWFKPHFTTMVASIFGVALVDRFIRRK